MLSFLLLKQIAQLFLIIFMGWAAVKAGLLHAEDSAGLSKILLYVITPCMIIKAFQLERTPETAKMMMLTFGVDLFLNILLILMTIVFGKLFHLNPVERASVILPNCTNMIIPLVTALFGAEWVVFISIYGMMQIVVAFTYGSYLISGETRFSPKKILMNANVIAIIVGFSLFVFQIHLPELVQGALTNTASMLGPAAMLMLGMLMSGLNWKKIKDYVKVWRVVLLRLIVYPVIMVLIVKYSGAAKLAANGEMLLLICLLSACAPVGNIVMQFCQLYDNEPEYASFANVVTMLLCIVTMPLMVALYQM